MEFDDLKYDFGMVEPGIKEVEDTWGEPDWGDDEYDDDDDDESNESTETIIDSSEGFEEDKERARSVFRTSRDRTLTSWFMSDKNEIIFRQDYACHAEFNDYLNDPRKIVASCFNARVNLGSRRSFRDQEDYVDNQDLVTPVAEKYWDFLMGSDSPWKMLFEVSYPEKIMTDDGVLAGFFLEPTMCREYPKLALNLCIAARMIGEEREAIFMWDHLVFLGVPRTDALYLARMIKFQKGLSGPVTQWTHNDSSHWPLLNSEYSRNRAFDFHAFREGRPDLSRPVETLYWCQAKSRSDFDLGFLVNRKNLQKNRNFNYDFDIQDVIEEFFIWQDKHDQKVKEERIAA
jgi:hypothetical protein